MKKEEGNVELVYKNFVLKKDDDRFDLFENKIGKKEDGSIKESQINIGYSFKFENALHQIVSRSVKDATTIPEYIKEYKEVLNDVTNTLKS
jgi:hypothetical protein